MNMLVRRFVAVAIIAMLPCSGLVAQDIAESQPSEQPPEVTVSKKMKAPSPTPATSMATVLSIPESSPPSVSPAGQTQSESSSTDSPEIAHTPKDKGEASEDVTDKDKKTISKKLPTGRDTPSGPDPVLVDIEKQLKLLVQGRFPEDGNIQLLFDVSLDNIDALAGRIEQFRTAQGMQRSNRNEKKKRKNNLLFEFPPPTKPASLDTPPTTPVPPVEPPPPVQPDMRRPRGKLTSARPQRWQDAYNAWQTYDAQQQAYVLSMEQFQKEFDSFQLALKAHEEAVASYSQTQSAFDAAIVAHQIKFSAMKRELQHDLNTITLRSRILALRLKYLSALHVWLKPMTAPARTALTGLKQQRKALRDTLERTATLSKKIDALVRRLKIIANRADAGSMIGFQIKLSQLSTDTRLIADALHQRKKKIQSERESLHTLRLSLQKQSDEVRHLVFVNVFHPKRDQLIDAAFLKHLKDMRKTAKSWFFQDINSKSSDKVILNLTKIASSPDDISSYSEGTAVIENVKPLLEELDAQLDEMSLFREHQKQIFRREAVSVLSSIATDETRSKAYSVSQELLSDLSSDLYSLKNTISSWIEDRKESIAEIPLMIRSTDGVLLLVRLFSAITLLILTGLLGRRLSRIVAVSIQKLSRSELFRHRLGQLMRWAGIAEAVLPTILVGATLYASLAIIGFHVPEIRFSEVILRWMLIYKFGGKLLDGLTKRVSRGRPAFVRISPHVAGMLSGTYRKLGLVVAIAAVILEWTTQWFGSGIFNTLIVHLLWGWLCIWGLWALFIWRPIVAESLLIRFTTENTKLIGRLMQRIYTTGEWMKRSRMGAILTAPAVMVLLIDWLYRRVRYLLYEGGIVTFFRARLIRRLVNTQKKNSVIPPPVLPSDYTKSFPLYPIYDEEDAVILPRKRSVDEICQQIERWQSTRQDSSLVLLGEKGVGKTTLLTLLEQELATNVLRHSIGQKLKSEKALVDELASALEMTDYSPVIGSVASFLNQGDERIVLLDEGHNVFLRTIDGYDAYESLIRLVNVTSKKVFWVLVFNTFSFVFLNASKKRLHYFRRLHELPTWTRDDLFELISKRNKQSNFDIEFDEVLLDANRSSTGDFEVIEGAEGFFRLLWENSGGNPRVATCLWLNSLTSVGERKIRVGIFSETLAVELSKMDTELLYTLAAICQHENLSVSELRDVLNVSTDFANFAVRFLTEYGLLEPKHTDPRRHTLAPGFYPQVLKLLRSHHLLYEME